MPRVSVWLVRTALLNLLAGTGLGALLLAGRGFPEVSPAVADIPIHAELMLVGWMLQLTFGVAWWILPKHAAGEARGPESAAWAAWILLNSGVLLTGLSLPLGRPAWALAGHAAELMAAACFASGVWGRVKPWGVGRTR